MFTYVSHYHSDLNVKAYFDNNWNDITLRELYPSKWDSGYRYQRSTFWRNTYRMRMLAASTCVRFKKAEKLRFFIDKWPITPGIPASFKKNVKSNLVLTWNCSNAMRTGKGTLVS